MSVIDRKKIAKNTLLLYVRMGVMLLISLYTSRVVLDALGEVDFGIYNAVGGIVAMFSFISGTMSGACQRFFLMEMGENRQEQLRNMFSLCLTVFCAFALIVLLITEPLGGWFLDFKMKVAGRTEAAHWVFHCSILSFIVAVVRLPYQGMVIAKEKMKVFAYISIFEALCALAVALLLVNSGYDHLKEYAVLMLATQVIITLLYILYCLRYYPECHWRKYWDGKKFKEIFAFSGWNLIGSSASVFKVHGVNILLNMFYNPAVNAARGLAFKIYSVVSQLQENFMTASKPQIIQSYRNFEFDGMKKLVWQSSKFSSYLMLLFSVPVAVEIEFLLGIWLKEVPDFTALFAVIMLANALVDFIDQPVWMVIQAVGKMRNYQLVVGGIQLLVLPISYVMLKFSSVPPQAVLYVTLAISCIAVVARLIFAKHLAGLKPSEFVIHSILPVVGVAAIMVAAALPIHSALPACWVRLIAVFFISALVEAMSVMIFGVTKKERNTILDTIKRKFTR